MNTSWYCTDCETRIEKGEIEEHERQGHQVSGMLRPDRLIGNDPWNMNVHVDREEGQ